MRSLLLMENWMKWKGTFSKASFAGGWSVPYAFSGHGEEESLHI